MRHSIRIPLHTMQESAKSHGTVPGTGHTTQKLARNAQLMLVQCSCRVPHASMTIDAVYQVDKCVAQGTDASELHRHI